MSATHSNDPREVRIWCDHCGREVDNCEQFEPPDGGRNRHYCYRAACQAEYTVRVAEVESEILDLQVEPCEGVNDLGRYMRDLTLQNAANVERRHEDGLMEDFKASIIKARTRP